MNITGIVSLSNALTPAVPNEAIVNADGKDYIFIVTDKKADEHHDEEAEEHDHKHDEAEHDHDHSKTEHNHKEEANDNVNFEKIEVVKGVSNMGYTAVTFVQDIPSNAKIVTKGAFFINAKLTNTGGHEH
jgi:ABC-type Zn2+ transport system substrate-binding protein/surface adhesin